MPLGKSGIYKITCVPTGKVYVGSAVDLYRLWHARHLPQLRRNKHVNRYLQAAWNKYGESVFQFATIAYVAIDDLLQREQYWIDKLQSANAKHGFNLCPIAGSSLGTKHSAASKTKMAAVHSKCYVVRDPCGRERQITNLFQFCQRKRVA